MLLLVVPFALTLALVPMSSRGASSSTVVSVIVPSATTLTTGACASGTPGVTEFGTVLPGSAARTTSDCTVTFGSSNDTATLRLSQADGTGTAMQKSERAAMNTGSAAILTHVAEWDRSTAWIAGNGGIILKTTNGGATWTPQASGVADNIRGAFVQSSTDVVMVGYNGRILRTTTGGTSWSPVASPTVRNLDDVTAVDSTTMLAVGGDSGLPVVLRSTTSGASWTDVTPGALAEAISAVSMANASRGWFVGGSGTVYRTDDGGLTWVVQNILACNTSDVRGVAAISTTVVVAVGHLGRICRSTDAGATWSLIPSGTAENLWDIDRAADGALWVVGRSATSSPVLRSLDDGATWSTVTTEAVNLEQVAAFDRETAWWVGWNGLAARIPSGSLTDYDDAAGNDWSSSSSMFGVCASSVTNAAAVWPTSAGCPMSDGTHWRAVPATTADAASRVATSALGVDTGEARFRFGFRPSSSTAPGRYVASLSFELVAPGT